MDSTIVLATPSRRPWYERWWRNLKCYWLRTYRESQDLWRELSGW